MPVRTFLSRQLYEPAARFFTDKAAEAESAHSESQKLESRVYAFGAMLSAVAYMESFVNGIFIRASDSTGVGGLPPQVCEELAAKWLQEKQGRGFGSPKSLPKTLCKYVSVAKIITAEQPTWPDGLLDEASDLINLRNALVHYGAYWPSVMPADLVSLVHSLRSRFAPNRFYPEPENAFWPKGVLGRGSSEWCLEVAQRTVAWLRGLLPNPKMG